MTSPAETITIEVPDIEELLADHPHAICTPLRGTSRVLPAKACPVADELQWSWSTIERKVTIDGAHVRIGDRAKSYPLTGGPITFKAREDITLYARLVDLRGLA